MSDRLQWGIIGAGAIARAFAHGVQNSKRCVLQAVASRSREKADAFADEFDIPGRHGSCDAILHDPDVQAVYITTPHPVHAEWAIKCADAGKHILCEKPVTINAAEAAVLIEAARRNDVFFMEAFMYRCSAQTARLVELLREGVIGEVRAVEARFSFDVGNNLEARHLKESLGGGGILDLGCYCASFARMVAGVAAGADIAEPTEVHAAGQLHETTGVDVFTAATLKFPNDIVAQLSCAVGLNQPSVAAIYGSKGRIDVPSPWFCAGRDGGSSVLVVERYGGEKTEEITIDTDDTLYGREADHVAEHLDNRQGVFPGMTWRDTLGNMTVLDKWRAAIGLQYESEKPENMTMPLYGRPLKPREKHTMRYGRMDGLDKDVAVLAMGATIGSYQACSAVWDEYIECGGNTFDSAFVYGDTDAKLGQWMRNRGIRDEVCVIAKGAHPPHCNPEALTRELLTTLENMQTDRIDIYLMHRDNLEIPVGEFVDVLNEHVAAGRIRIFGGSNWTIDRIEQANVYAESHGKDGFRVLSNNFSLARMVQPPWTGCRTASDAASRAWLEEKQFPLIPWSSQAQGFFVPEFARPGNPEFWWADMWFSDDNFERRNRAAELAGQRGVIATSIALAYVLHQAFPVFALFCPHNAYQLGTSLEALSIELSPEEMKWLNLEDE